MGEQLLTGDDLYAGKHHDTGFNFQVASLDGRLLAVCVHVPCVRHDGHAFTPPGLSGRVSGTDTLVRG